jgi:hypothetical protein
MIYLLHPVKRLNPSQSGRMGFRMG